MDTLDSHGTVEDFGSKCECTYQHYEDEHTGNVSTTQQEEGDNPLLELFPELYAEMKEAFINMDDDRDGELQLPEIKSLMGAIGLDPSDEEALDLMKEVDEDGNGNLDFEEFSSLMATKLALYTPKDEITMALKSLEAAAALRASEQTRKLREQRYSFNEAQQRLSVGSALNLASCAPAFAATVEDVPEGMISVADFCSMLTGLGLNEMEVDEITLWLQPSKGCVDYVGFVDTLMKAGGDTSVFRTSGNVVANQYHAAVRRRKVQKEAGSILKDLGQG